MTDEEKKAIEILKLRLENASLYVRGNNEVFYNALGIVLKLIEKQQKEIEELDLTTVYISGVYDGEKKVEDKIKAKIKQLDYNDIGNFERRCKQEVLQSLLEEE